jgi:hypothetical protein
MISGRLEMFSCDAKTGEMVNAIFLVERENRVGRAILSAVPHRAARSATTELEIWAKPLQE